MDHRARAGTGTFSDSPRLPPASGKDQKLAVQPEVHSTSRGGLMACLEGCTFSVHSIPTLCHQRTREFPSHLDNKTPVVQQWVRSTRSTTWVGVEVGVGRCPESQRLALQGVVLGESWRDHRRQCLGGAGWILVSKIPSKLRLSGFCRGRRGWARVMLKQKEKE